jgi:hypothetical protein
MNQGRAITEADQQDLKGQAEAMMADLRARVQRPLRAPKRDASERRPDAA